MSESGIHPLRAAILVLLSAGALAGCTLLGVHYHHALLGALVGYVVYLIVATRAFRSSFPGADQVVDDGRLPRGKRLSAVAVASALALAYASTGRATSSTVFWTPATTYVQPYLVPHVTYDSYVAERSALQTDYGLTLGVLPFEKVQCEVGFDSFLPGVARSNLYLNGKLVVPEGALGKSAPGLSFGIVGVGFDHGVSDFDVLHAAVGKTVPKLGTFAAGGYYGLNANLMVSSTGGHQRGGFLGSWTSPDILLDLAGLRKINFIADVQTGRNAFGAWGAGMGVYFTDSIDVLTGPVFFFDPAVTTQLSGPGFPHGTARSRMLWTIQLDVDFDLRHKNAK